MAKKRKLIDLPTDTEKTLQALANSANNSLKAYMEWVLIQHANNSKEGAKGLK